MASPDQTDQAAAYFGSWDDQVFGDEQRIYRVIQLLTKGLVRGDVLDLGCGSWVYYDVGSVDRWVGLDLSQKLLNDLKFIGSAELPGSIEKIQGSCAEIPSGADSFDTVIAIFLLHHLARVDRRRTKQAVGGVLREARRVIRPGGTLLVLETWPQIGLHLYHLLYPLLYPLARRWRGIELPYFLGPRTLERLAGEAGFRECYALAVRLYEDVRQPVLGFVLPAWVQPLFQKYTIYIIKP